MNVHYSQRDKAILMRWQVAKVRSDWRVFVPPGVGDDVPAEDKTIQAEYYAARDALKDFENTDLVTLAKQVHPDVPEVDLNTAEGYGRWCQVQPVKGFARIRPHAQRIPERAISTARIMSVPLLVQRVARQGGSGKAD